MFCLVTCFDFWQWGYYWVKSCDGWWQDMWNIERKQDIGLKDLFYLNTIPGNVKQHLEWNQRLTIYYKIANS